MKHKRNTRRLLSACVSFVTNLLPVGMGDGGTSAVARASVNGSKKTNQNTKEQIMYLYLKETIKNLGDDEQRFFRCAYMWRFGKDYDCVTDVCQFRLHAIIPKYVEEYVRHLQSK